MVRFDSVAYLLPADSMRSAAVATGRFITEAKRRRAFRVAAVLHAHPRFTALLARMNLA